MIIRILTPSIMSYCRAMPLLLILARDSKLTIHVSSWLTIHVTLEHLVVLALVSIPFLIVVYTVTISLHLLELISEVSRE